MSSFCLHLSIRMECEGSPSHCFTPFSLQFQFTFFFHRDGFKPGNACFFISMCRSGMGKISENITAKNAKFCHGQRSAVLSFEEWAHFLQLNMMLRTSIWWQVGGQLWAWGPLSLTTPLSGGTIRIELHLISPERWLMTSVNPSWLLRGYWGTWRLEW